MGRGCLIMDRSNSSAANCGITGCSSRSDASEIRLGGRTQEGRVRLLAYFTTKDANACFSGREYSTTRNEDCVAYKTIIAWTGARPAQQQEAPFELQFFVPKSQRRSHLSPRQTAGRSKPMDLRTFPKRRLQQGSKEFHSIVIDTVPDHSSTASQKHTKFPSPLLPKQREQGPSLCLSVQ
ncbi:hypothetical protein MPH_00974 [Macrophomina phaseolina MS6]|uniref:Uncharacterized protein n=1 Tax=Macrophomina phaseolina (strain MS6) TaxID=1126212 RepID=K2SGU0_MACPH|nr:hypothetical protein MPH_00974 [Macrophomina phaseolina MS6]